ncbi:MAG: hypothetical protein IK145_04615 [Bacteroidales bacterium]|nr:hypothetical protein [Bacteroidales bacterium]
MKRFIRYFALIAGFAAILSGCYDDRTDYPSEETRITIYPEVPTFNSDGTTSSGEDSYVCAVTIFNGTAVSDMSWKAEPVSPKDWATVSDASFVMQYTDNSGKKTYDVSQPGFEVAMQPNPEYRRQYEVMVTAADGTTKLLTFVQLGQKADAEVTSGIAELDIPADGGLSDVIEYVTNMGEYSYSITYEGEDSGWLEIVDMGLGKVALKASQWANSDRGRSAVLTITVGSETTSLASIDIKVNQLKNDIFYYLFGPSIDTERLNAVQMTKEVEGIYTFKGFIFDSGTNYLCLNRDTRSESYPVYYLKNDGTIGSSDKAVTTSDLVVPANGIYTLTADFNTMTWKLDRVVKVSSCMPDSELPNYPTKDYPTEDGGFKTWMTVSLHWDGGPNTGAYKIGTGIAPGHGVGAYPIVSTTTAIVRKPENETVENGGTIVELVCKDGNGTMASRFGRLYTQTEMITGAAKGGLENAQWINFPQGEPGEEYVDDAGMEMTLECVPVAKLVSYEASHAGDLKAEEENPTLKIQIQGICPFGWHIANMQDWKDLVYATSAAKATDYPVDAANATYNKIASVLKIPNAAALLYGADWQANTTLGTAPAMSSAAADFGWNMFPTGWRLISSGWAYGPDDNTSKPGFMASIPLMADSNGDGARHRSWRVVVTGQGAILQFAATHVVGEGSATALRCVKNYNSK